MGGIFEKLYYVAIFSFLIFAIGYLAYRFIKKIKEEAKVLTQKFLYAEARIVDKNVNMEGTMGDIKSKYFLLLELADGTRTSYNLFENEYNLYKVGDIVSVKYKTVNDSMIRIFGIERIK